MTKRCIHIISLTDYAPELCEITIPSIQAYAKRMDASINMIGSNRKFAEYPDTYERFQVFHDGRGFDWNFVVDANMLFGPSLGDFCAFASRETIGTAMTYGASSQFSVDNRFFGRDGRNIAPVQACILTSDWTHDLWEPFKGTAANILSCTTNEYAVAEYMMAYNIAKYGLKCNGIFPTNAQLLRVNPPDHLAKTALKMIHDRLETWSTQ